MVFAKELRDLVRSGEITCSIRVWHRPRVKVGGRYPLFPGFVVVESVEEIEMDDLDDAMASESGFGSVRELLATARHGCGERVFIVRFRFE